MVCSNSRWDLSGGKSVKVFKVSKKGLKCLKLKGSKGQGVQGSRGQGV